MCAAVMCLSVMLAGCKKKSAEVTLESIAVTTPPTKTEYLVNETFSSAGMVVTATYSDKSSKPVTVTEAMLSGFDSATPGAKTVTITYTEKGVTKTATVSVTVKAEADTTPPALSAGTVNRTSDIAATISFTTNEAGTAYYLVLAGGAEAPTVAQVKAGTSLGAVTAGANADKAVELTAGARDIYVVVEDAAGNISAPLKIEAPAYSAPFVAVTNITGVPTTAAVGTPLVLTGTVAPANATNKRIVWSIVSTTPIVGVATMNYDLLNYQFYLNPTGAGTVTVRATITNGASPTSDYTKDFTITVREFSGSGTSGSPYLISTAADLNKLSQLINAGNETYAAATVYYQLNGDIDMSGTSNFTPIGNSVTNSFKGTFDGNGKIITNLTVNTTSTSNYAGLFGRVDGGKISNLGLANVNIKGGDDTGGVAGYISGSGASITGCYVTGTVIGTAFVGGIAGTVGSSSTVRNCYTTCSVSSTRMYVGGIAGDNFGTINNCYATGAISGIRAVGGIAGLHAGGTVTRCVALNPSITRNAGSTYTDFGRVVGWDNSSGGIADNAAFSGMQALGGIIFGAGAHNNQDGEDINATQAKTRATYENAPRNWAFGTSDAAPWKWTVGTYLLPVFYWQNTAPSAMPGHL